MPSQGARSERPTNTVLTPRITPPLRLASLVCSLRSSQKFVTETKAGSGAAPKEPFAMRTPMGHAESVVSGKALKGQAKVRRRAPGARAGGMLLCVLCVYPLTPAP